MTRMRFRIPIGVWLGWLLACTLAWAQSPGAPVRVGVFENPPIVSTPPDRPPEGIAIDMLRHTAEREGWRINWVPGAWDTLVKRLERGEIDLLVGIAYNEARAERFRFTRESLVGNWGMVFRNRDAAIESLPDLKGRRVALMRGSTHSQALVDLAAGFDAHFTPVYLDSYEAVLDAVAEGRADAGAVNRVFAAVHAQRPGVIVTAIVFNPVFVHYAAPMQGDPALLAALDRELAALKAEPDSAYYASLRRWLQAAAESRYPAWLPWVGATIGGLLVIVLAVAAALRHQVRRQTGELQRRADQLQLEIEQREQAQKHLNRLAYFDPLTQLPNRESFRVELDTSLADLQGRDERLALLFVDVDRLKNVNDGLGHGAGDLLLEQIASRLRSVLRAHDYLSRFGGDEFVVIVSNIVAPSDAELVATRMLKSLVSPIDIGPTQVYTSASIGIALYPDDANSAEALLKHADTAMYHAKEQGGNRFDFYHAQQTERVVERLTLDTQLRQALDRGELVLHYQPIVELGSRRVVGVEALMRWEHPERGLLMPGAFIPAAEDTGLIVPLGAWALEAGCAQLREWQKHGLAEDVTLAVNVSTRQFEGQHLVSAVEQALTRSGLAPECLELEITENVMLIMNDEVRASLDALRAMGVQLALDDFGTGYSSLSYLKELPFHALKIDRSFVSRIPGQRGDTQIITAILALARGLELQVVAEGIETPDQYDFLREQGCEFGQGYLMSRPRAASELEGMLGGG